MDPEASQMDPEMWARRFDELTKLVRDNAKLARQVSMDAAASAAIKVTGENVRSQMEIKQELLKRQDEDRKAQDHLHAKVDTLHGQMTEVLSCLTKLSTTKLIQTAITSLVLAAMVVIMIKVLGG